MSPSPRRQSFHNLPQSAPDPYAARALPSPQFSRLALPSSEASISSAPPTHFYTLFFSLSTQVPNPLSSFAFQPRKRVLQLRLAQILMTGCHGERHRIYCEAGQFTTTLSCSKFAFSVLSFPYSFSPLTSLVTIILRTAAT